MTFLLPNSSPSPFSHRFFYLHDDGDDGLWHESFSCVLSLVFLNACVSVCDDDCPSLFGGDREPASHPHACYEAESNCVAQNVRDAPDGGPIAIPSN